MNAVDLVSLAPWTRVVLTTYALMEVARRGSGSRYAIAYVSNVGEPREARVELLPYPKSDEGEAAIYFLADGIRYGFRRG